MTNIKCNACGYEYETRKPFASIKYKQCPKCRSTRITEFEVHQPAPLADTPAISEQKSGISNDQLIVRNAKPYYPRYIQGLKDTAILGKAWELKMNTLLIGDTGTGKTHAIRSLATKLKVPYIRVNLDAMVTVEDLIGEFKPSEKGFVWQDGVLTRLVRSGGIFVCDEINAAPPEVLFVLHGLLDDDRQIVLRQKDGEVLKAHPNFWFIATMNPDYEGTKPLNQALYDRFQVTLNYDYDKRTESKLVKSEKLLELAKKFRQMYVKGEIATPCSTRQLIQYEENKKIFGADLANEIFVNRFATEERKPVREALDMEFSTTGKSKMPDKPEDDANANDSN